MGELIRVPVGTDYEVLVGRGILAGQAVAAVPGRRGQGAGRLHGIRSPARRHDPGRYCRGAGLAAYQAVVPDAEAAKTSASVAARLWGVLGQAGFTRTDAVIGVGGGAVTDLAGFVAATWLRGVAVVQVPTSWPAWSTPRWAARPASTPPRARTSSAPSTPRPGWCATSTPGHPAARRAVARDGRGRQARVHRRPAHPGAHRGRPGRSARSRRPGAGRVGRALDPGQGAVVAADLRESSLREILNYGHTFGTPSSRSRATLWRHGTRCRSGWCMPRRWVACPGGRSRWTWPARHTVLGVAGLPVRYPTRRARLAALLTAMSRDKKTRGATLRFVVLDGLGHAGAARGARARSCCARRTRPRRRRSRRRAGVRRGRPGGCRRSPSEW
jgi:3-dehydroquinate synthase